MAPIWILLGVSALLLSVIVLIFNSLIAAKQMAENGWSDIEVQLKRRADLIPQLVATVKAYAKHEKTLFEDVTAKRNAALAAGASPSARAAAETALARPVSRLLAVAEDYPELKANQNFLDLQNELSDTEDKIEMARRFYNGAVRELNTKVQSFPSNMVASAMRLGIWDYFEIEAGDAARPDLDFDNG